MAHAPATACRSAVASGPHDEAGCHGASTWLLAFGSLCILVRFLYRIALAVTLIFYIFRHFLFSTFSFFSPAYLASTLDSSGSVS
jgi:hypothetical protein